MADSIITSEAPTNSSQLNPPSRIICRVCQKQFSQYTCPRCNTRYCSLPCYKSHSNRCTESFMRDNVMGEMQQMGPDDDTKQKMLDILKRFHSEEEEEEADTMEENDNDFTESSLSEETIQKIMSGLEITFDDLSTEEKKHFQRAIATGQLSKMIEPWDPWWLKPSARTISLSPQGTQLVQPMTPDQDPAAAAPPSVPPGPTTPLPPVSKLTGSTQPSPLLPVHLIDILYSYCFTLRLHNGDWESDAVGSATTAITISNVLSQSGQPETVSESVGRCLEQACGPAFGHMGGARFGAAVLDDVASVLDLGSDGVVCALCDLHRMIEKGVKEMKKGGDLEIKGKLKGGLRKVYFMMCWVHEQGEEVWSSLVGLVRGEKNVVMEYLGNGKGEWKKGERKGKVVIEEV